MSSTRLVIHLDLKMKIFLLNSYLKLKDVLYDLLNCYEHLELYAKLKGIPSDEIKNKVRFYLLLKN